MDIGSREDITLAPRPRTRRSRAMMSVLGLDPLDEHWAGLLPHYVLTGFPSTAFAGLVVEERPEEVLEALEAFFSRKGAA